MPDVEEQHAARRDVSPHNRGLKLHAQVNVDGPLPPGLLFPPTKTMLRTMPRIEPCQSNQIGEDGSAGVLRQQVLCYNGCKA